MALECPANRQTRPHSMPVFKTGRAWQPHAWMVRFHRRSVAGIPCNGESRRRGGVADPQRQSASVGVHLGCFPYPRRTTDLILAPEHLATPSSMVGDWPPAEREPRYEGTPCSPGK